MKIPTFAPTCFGSNRNHHQGAILCLTKTTIMLICRHNIDHVNNDEHNTAIIVVLAKHRIAP